MPVFAYSGMDAGGRPTKGVRDADSPKALRAVLRREGIFLTDVREDRSSGARKPAPGAAGNPGKSGSGLSRQINLKAVLTDRISRSDIAVTTRQLATLLKAGINLSESLGALFDQIEKPSLKRIIGDIRTRVNEGTTLADALGSHKNQFNELYTSMVRAGETAGNLDAVLSRLADFQEAELKLRSKVMAAMIYPIIMAIVGIGIVAILMIAVIPKITEIFQDNDQTLPWNTELLIWSSRLIGKYWLIIMALAALGAWAFVWWKRKPKGKAKWHAIVLKMPLVGPLVRMIAVARFSRTLGTMMASGVPLLKALDVAKEILGNMVLVNAVETAKEAIKEGESIAVTLRKSGQFPAIVTHMIAVGERTGQLEEMLNTVAVTYEDEVEMKLTKLTSMLEPLMLVVMGGAIAFVVFSILMPIMDMQNLATQ